MTDEGITHNSTEPPELAPAVLVEIKDWNMSFMAGGVKMNPLDQGAQRHPSIRRLRAGEVGSWFMLEYRVFRNPDGHPYVSAEGLEPWARWVATDKSGEVWQFTSRPHIHLWGGENLWWPKEGFAGTAFQAPGQFRHPGDWRDSLCAVWREDHE